MAEPRSWRRMVPIGVYAVVTLLWYWRVWTPIDGAAATFKYDPVHEYWADLVYQIETLARGELALWNPHDRGGFPLYGDPQPGLLYPGSWPLLLWGLVTGDTGYHLMELKVLAHWLLGCVGMHWLLRRLRQPEAACYLGGLVFGFAEPAIRYGGNALNWSYAWLPWLLLAVEAFADEPDRRRAILLGAATAMTLLAGAPAVFLYGLILAVPWGLWRLWGRLRSQAGLIALAALVFVAWTAPLLLGNLEQVPHSVRDVRNLEFITFSTFTPTQLIYMVLPRLGLYYGALVLLLSAAWLSTGRPRAILVMSLFGAGLLFSLGHNADVLGATASVLSPFTLFRRAHRFLYVATAALAIASACGFGVLLRAEGRRAEHLGRGLAMVALVIAAVIGVALLAALATGKDLVTARNDAFGLGAVSAVFAAFLLHRLARTAGVARRRWGWVVVVVVGLDLWLAYSAIHAMGYGPKPRPTRDAAVAELDGVSTGEVRVYDRGVLAFRPGVRLRIRDFGGYEDDPLGLERYKLLREAAMRQPALLGHANVRYVLDKRNPRLPLRRPAAVPVAPEVHELAAFSPRVYYAPRARVADDAKGALAELWRFQPGEDAVIEGAQPPQDRGAEPVAGRVVSESSNRIEIEIDTPGPGVVVVNEAYFPAWSATVDGRPADIVPANLLFRAVTVSEAGRHRIVMSLQPGRFYLALIPFLVGLVATAWAIGFRRRRG